MPDLTHAAATISLINAAWTLLLTIVIWLRKPGQDAQLAVTRLREECHACRAAQERQFGELRRDEERRLTEIETHIEHMPTAAAVSALDSAIREVGARLVGMHELQATMSTKVSLIEQYLLTNTHLARGG